MIVHLKQKTWLELNHMKITNGTQPHVVPSPLSLGLPPQWGDGNWARTPWWHQCWAVEGERSEEGQREEGAKAANEYLCTWCTNKSKVLTLSSSFVMRGKMMLTPPIITSASRSSEGIMIQLQAHKIFQLRDIMLHNLEHAQVLNSCYRYCISTNLNRQCTDAGNSTVSWTEVNLHIAPLLLARPCCTSLQTWRWLAHTKSCNIM